MGGDVRREETSQRTRQRQGYKARDRGEVEITQRDVSCRRAAAAAVLDRQEARKDARDEVQHGTKHQLISYRPAQAHRTKKRPLRSTFKGKGRLKVKGRGKAKVREPSQMNIAGELWPFEI